MYELLNSSRGVFVGLRIPGDIGDTEHQAIIDLIQRRFQQFGPVRLLVIYEAAPGMIGAETLYENLRFAKLAGDKLAKMAVIGKQARESTWIGLFGLFGGIQANYYAPNELEAALAWLNS